MEGWSPRRAHRRFAALLHAIVVLVACVGTRAAPSRFHFDIPAGYLGETVVVFSRQTGIQTMYGKTVDMERVLTNAVVGDFEPAEALRRMLKGTGLTFEFDKDNVVLILSAAEAKSLESQRGGKPQEAAIRDELQTTKSAEETQEVLVTGSLIRGVMDIMSPLLSITRREIKEATYGTVEDTLLTLPLNSLSAQNEITGGVGNFHRGTAPNLRGLGYGATLVLVNGRRQPAAGASGDFVDISNIPWSVVDHIEVLPDGASALYGSDAIAGVVNVILRDHLRGAETMLRAGTTADGASETLIAQLFGNQWDSGKWLLGYQYSNRTALAAADRTYTANTDKRSLGGRDFRTFRSNPGNILDSRTFIPAYAIPSGQDGTSLTPDDLLPGVVNLQNQFAIYDLLPCKTMHSAFFSTSKKINRFELFAEARFSQRDTRYSGRSTEQLLFVPRSNPFFVDPVGGLPFVIVAYNFLDDLGPLRAAARTRSYVGTIGGTADLRSDWRTTLSASYGQETLQARIHGQPDPFALALALADPSPATAFNPFADGSATNSATLQAIKSVQEERAISTISTRSVVADGPLFTLPSGSMKLAIGAEQRLETLDHQRTVSVLSLSQSFDREVASIFSELSVPLAGNGNDLKTIPRLELSVAGRYEHYSDFGHTVNPKVGLRWVPSKWMKLRTSWGSSFRAPKLVDLYDTTNDGAGMVLFPDPTSETGQSLVAVLQGSNPHLKEETAMTWTAGIDLAPQTMPGLTASLTYFQVNYENQVLRPGPLSPLGILMQEDQWKFVITRDPSPAEIVAFCNRPDFEDNVTQCLASSPAAIIDFRLRNLASTKENGVDIKVNHSVDTRFGNFNLELNGNYLFDFDRAITKTSPSVNILNTVSNPLALRFRSLLGWNQHSQNAPGLGINLILNYAGSYHDTESPVHPRIDASTTLDLQASYRTSTGEDWFNDMDFLLNAVNLFNKDPPFVDKASGYDDANFAPYGRVISLSVEKSW